MRASWLVLVAGCSFAGLRSPGEVGDQCTTSHVVPTVDAALAVGFAAVVVTAIVKTSRCKANLAPGEENMCGFVETLYGVPALLASAVDGAAAVYGFSTVHSCHVYKRSHTAEVR